MSLLKGLRKWFSITHWYHHVPFFETFGHPSPQLYASDNSAVTLGFPREAEGQDGHPERTKKLLTHNTTGYTFKGAIH